MRHFSTLNPAKTLIAALLLVIFMTAFYVPMCHAVPSEDDLTDPAPTTGWVDLQATAPEGFTGSVSVMFHHNKTGETFTLSSYALGDFYNSIQVPVGEYTIDEVYTSEDPFIYEAFISQDSFTLEYAAQVLDVVVEMNEEAALFLESPDAAIPPAVEAPAPAASSEEPVEVISPPDVSEEPPETPDAASPSVPDQSEPQPSYELGEEEEKTFTLIERLGMIAVGTFTFVGIVLLVAWVVRRRFSD